MIPSEAKNIWYFYGGITVLALILVLWRRPRRRMRLQLGGRVQKAESRTSASIDGAVPSIEANANANANANASANASANANANANINFNVKVNAENLSRIQPAGERPLNVVFNYNGHSWDAYEVLGLPAGSSLEKVDEAYLLAKRKNDPTSAPFLQSAYQAIVSEWCEYKKSI